MTEHKSKSYRLGYPKLSLMSSPACNIHRWVARKSWFVLWQEYSFWATAACGSNMQCIAKIL